MIKNIYDKNNKYYIHEYYCDDCFKQICYGEILRHKKARIFKAFDLCVDCWKKWNNDTEK